MVGRNGKGVLLEIPFYQNEGDPNACYQIAMKSVIKYFLGEEKSIAELDKATGRSPGFLTTTLQVLPALDDAGLRIKCYSSEGLDLWLKPEPEIAAFIRQQYGKDAEYMLTHFDLKATIDAAKKVTARRLYEIKKLSLADIENALGKGAVPMVLINWYVISGKEGFYGHFVVVTGYDGGSIYVNNPGPENPQANMRISKDIFEKAWNSRGTDNDAVIAYGKR